MAGGAGEGQLRVEAGEEEHVMAGGIQAVPQVDEQLRRRLYGEGFGFVRAR